MATNFDEFVKLQNAPPPDPGKTPEEELKEWRHYLEKLYVDIESFLCPYTEKSQINITREVLSLYEDLLGNYDVEKMVIRIGKAKAELIPVGTFLIGSKGRVEMEGPRGSANLVLVDKDAKGMTLTVQTVSINGKKIKKEKDVPVKEIEWSWKFATYKPGIVFTPLTKDSFLDTLMGVVDG